jgi:hypothetical protein
VHAGQRGRRHHLLQHLDRVVLQDAQVARVRVRSMRLQQRADAGRMHLDADEVEFRPGLRI